MNRKKNALFYFFQSIIRFFSSLHYWYHQQVRNLFPSQWVREGECSMCGSCCDFPTLTRGSFYFRVKIVLNFIIKWHEFWYGFQFYELKPEQYQIVFRCSHLRPDRTCDDYPHRPVMCRLYPEIRTWFAKPDFFEKCTYKPVRKIEREINKLVSEFQQRAQSSERVDQDTDGEITHSPRT